MRRIVNRLFDVFAMLTFMSATVLIVRAWFG